MRSVNLCLITSLMLASSMVPALAAEAKLTLVVAGESYQAPPIFVVRYGTEIVGAGTADQSIVTPQSLDDSNIAAYSQTFNFTIYDFDPAAPKPISVEYQTDAYGGPGLDRNLYIESASIDGTQFPFDNAKTVRNGKLAKAELGKVKTIPLWNAFDTAIFTLPGWPAVVAPIATAAPAATPPADQPASAPEKTKPVPAVKTAAVASSGNNAKPAQTNAEPQQPRPAKAAACAPASITIASFKDASVKISAGDQQAIATLAQAIAGHGCYVTVTGYAGTAGDSSYNGSLSSTRAGNVARLLTSHGVQIAQHGVINGGPTDQFGPRSRDNVRVVVSIKP